MAEKKKRKRKAYLDSFQRGSDGKYVYQGDFYTFEQGKEALRRALLGLWGITAVMMAALTAAGCIGGPGTGNCFYVLMPYVLNVTAAISVCWGLVRLTINKEPLRAYVYEETAGQLPVRAVLSSVCAGAAVLGEGIYVFRNGTEGKTAGCILFLGAELLAGAAAVLLKKKISEMKWKKTSYKNG